MHTQSPHTLKPKEGGWALLGSSQIRGVNRVKKASSLAYLLLEPGSRLAVSSGE